MTFWLRRCMLQSRTPTAHTAPWSSAMSWTSTCRAASTTRSMKTVASPKALSPSLRALSNAGASPVSSSTRRMPSSAAAGGRLDHQRVADRFRVVARRGEVVNRAAAPRRDRHAGLLGQQLGADLVAEPAHDVRARPDEDDAQPGAEIRELRALGHEAPAHPGRIGARGDERSLQGVEVEVRAARVRRDGRRRCRPPRPPPGRTSPAVRPACATRWPGGRSTARRAAPARR